MLISVDASQLEWRVALELSRDETGINEILQKLDTHSLNQQAFGLPERVIAKRYLFRTIFNRGKGYAFTVDPDFMHVSTSVRYWDEVGEKFYRKYHQLNEWHLHLGREVVAGRPIVSPLGLEWNIPLGTYKGSAEIPWTILTNYPVQGTAAVVMAIARVSFYKRLLKRKLDKVLLIQTVHDSITVDCPDEYFEEVVHLFYDVFKDLLMNIKTQFNYEWFVPLNCEVKYGKNMKEMEKILDNRV